LAYEAAPALAQAPERATATIAQTLRRIAAASHRITS
jgi:hypothetical protein